MCFGSINLEEGLGKTVTWETVLGEKRVQANGFMSHLANCIIYTRTSKYSRGRVHKVCPQSVQGEAHVLGLGEGCPFRLSVSNGISSTHVWRELKSQTQLLVLVPNDQALANPKVL